MGSKRRALRKKAREDRAKQIQAVAHRTPRPTLLTWALRSILHQQTGFRPYY